MRRATALALPLVLATASPALTGPVIITDPNDTTTRFEMPVKPTKRTPPTEQHPAQAPEKDCTEEGRTRYNGAPEVKGIEFCDGMRWVALMKLAPQADTATTANCAPNEEGQTRYNKNKEVKAYEYCNGAHWQKMGRPSSMAVASKVFERPMVSARSAPTLLTSGTFQEDGFIGAYLACDAGANQLSAYLTIGHDKTIGANGDKVAAATVLSNRSGANDVDHASFFSVVPKNTPWKIWIRDNFGNGILNKANCAIKVTKFGE